MNEEAKKVGARHTHFANPHGLHDPNHYTTAYDLSLIARAAMEYPFFNQTIRTRETTIHGNAKIGPQRYLVNRNKLLFRWAECDGVKTGYTKQAGRCLIASATRINPETGKPWRLLSVVMHSPDSWADSHKLLQHYGFEKFTPIVMARANQAAAPAKVSGGAFVTQAVTVHDVLLPLRRNERATLTQRAYLIPMAAPVAKGRAVGYLEFRAAGRTLAKVPLVARDAVPASMIVRVVPAAAFLLPSNPVWRFLLYGAVLSGVALLLSIRKVRANARGKTKRRRAAASEAVTRTGAATPAERRPARPAPQRTQRGTVPPRVVASAAAEDESGYAARRRSLEERVAARQLAERQTSERQRAEQEEYSGRAASPQRRTGARPGAN
jgi:D-alanyl-D-alanine carboxypeptidase (penicillin-binding protein 5/6)